MPLVDWTEELGEHFETNGQVVYSYLFVPHDRYELDQDVAQLHFCHGYKVDIEWCDDDLLYVVTLYHDVFEDQLAQHETRDVGEVIALVKRWANHYCRDTIWVSDAHNTVEDCVTSEVDIMEDAPLVSTASS